MENNNEIAISDTNMKSRKLCRHTVFLALIVMDLFVLLNFILKILVFHISTTLSNIILYWFFPLLINTILLIFLMVVLKELIPIYVDMILNKDFFEVYIQKTLYFKQFWNQVESIEIINIKSFGAIQHNIQFIGRENKLLRLSLIMIHEKKIFQFIKAVKTYSQYLNINVREKVEKIYFDNDYKKEEKIIKKLKRSKVNIINTIL